MITVTYTVLNVSLLLFFLQESQSWL